MIVFALVVPGTIVVLLPYILAKRWNGGIFFEAPHLRKKHGVWTR